MDDKRRTSEEKSVLTFEGPIVVHDPDDPYRGQYDEELVLTTSDWYHDQVPVLLHQMLVSTNTEVLPPFPEAILLNDANQATFYFTPGKTYKILVISMAALASTFLEFDSHTMRIIGVDGTYTHEYDANQIRVAPAQRYTFLLDAKPTDSKNYAFLASLDMNRDFAIDPNPVYPFNITGYIIYDDKKPLPSPYVVNKWTPADDVKFMAWDNQLLLGEPDKTITLNFNFGFDALGIPRQVSPNGKCTHGANQDKGHISTTKPTFHRKYQRSLQQLAQERRTQIR